MTIQLHGLKTTGLVPIGGVVATIPALAGAYSCAATTEADDLGYVKCNGQVINDPTSPLNGLTIPNINDDVFLKGHTTSNSAGGSNTHTHTIDEHNHTVPGHYHYYGSHWSNDNSSWNGSPYGNGSGNMYQDYHGYGGSTHTIKTHRGGNDYNWNSMYNPSGTVPIDDSWHDTGHHWHNINPHRHWIQQRVTHGGSLDGRNTMTSGNKALTTNSSSTQPKYITVLYVMRIK